MTKNSVQKIYVWDGPLRIFHWVMTISFFTLLITGLMIASPAGTSGGEPWNQFRIATTRNIHLLAANIFTICLGFRIIWFFAGNENSRWLRLHPFERDFWKELSYMVRKYFLLRHVHEGPHYVDHNALATGVYRIFYLLSFLLILTGFALRAGIDPDSTIFILFNWINPLLGNELVTRLWHHFIAWIATAIAIFHILWSISYTLLIDRSALMSMFTGYKKRASGWKPSKPWEGGSAISSM